MASGAELALIISAKDQASKILSGIGGQADGLGSKFAALGKVAAVGAGAGLVALGGILATSVKEAMESQKVIAQLDAVLESTGGAAGLAKKQLLDMASGFQKLTTFSDEAVLSAENVLLTFTQIKGPVVKGATQAVLDMSTALGQDLQSSAIQVGKALNDPIGGMTALKRVGVSFTDAQVEVIKKLVETGDTMGAQQLILQELSTEFGGSAAKAADTFGGRMAQLKNSLGEVQETIGMALLPILQRLAMKLSAFLTEHRADIERFTQAFVRLASEEVFPAIARAMGTVIDVAGLVAEKLKPIADWYIKDGDRLKAAAVGIGVVMTAAFTAWAVSAGAAAVTTIAAAAPVYALAGTIGVLSGAIFLLIKNWDEVNARVREFKIVVTAASVAAMVLLGPITVIAATAAIVAANWGTVAAVFNGFVTPAFNAAASVISWLVRQVERLIVVLGNLKFPKIPDLTPGFSLPKISVPGFQHGGFVPPGVVMPAILHGGSRGEIVQPVGQRGSGGALTVNLNLHSRFPPDRQLLRAEVISLIPEIERQLRR